MPINYALNPVKWGGQWGEEGREGDKRLLPISFLEGGPVHFIIAPAAKRVVESIAKGPFLPGKRTVILRIGLVLMIGSLTTFWVCLCFRFILRAALICTRQNNTTK